MGLFEKKPKSPITGLFLFKSNCLSGKKLIFYKVINSMEVIVETTHYEAKCIPELKEATYRYISDVEREWETMVDIFGKKPAIERYYIDFTVEKGVCYLGNGIIKIYKTELENLLPYPKDLTQGLTFETFHGFLEHVKHRPCGVKGSPYYGENKLGESFSTILKIELLDRLALSEDADAYRKGKGMGGNHHKLLTLLVKIHKEYGISLFQQLFRLLENQKRPLIMKELPKDELCCHFSSCAREDLSKMFEKHGYSISTETKEKIKDLIKI